MIEKLLQNPAFVGVIGVVIGSGLSLLGNILSQIILSRKEQKQWENQQLSEKNSWTRNEQKKEKEYLREIYQNSLRSLSVFISLNNQKEMASKEQQKLEIIDDVHKWITMLLLRHSNSKLDIALSSFVKDPDEYEAHELRKVIIELSNKEESFFLNSLNDQPEKIGAPDPDLRKIQIRIDDDFRKQQLIDGVEIPQNYEFEIKLSKMSNTQRSKLAEIFFQTRKTIPNKFSLYLPVYKKGAKQLAMNGQAWHAKINPHITEPDVILKSWEKDYETSYQDSKQSFQTQNED